MLNCKPIFKCGHTVDSSAMVPVTLKMNYDDGTSNKKNVYMIQPFGEMEDILYCVEEFKRAANYLGHDHADKFENFGNIVSGHDYDNWTAARTEGTENNENDFTECLEHFLLNCCDDCAQAAQIKHFVHCPEEHSEPMRLTVRAHAARQNAICSRIAQLPPHTGDEVTILQQKETLLASCPASWTKSFNDASVTSYKGAPLDEGDDTLVPRLFYTNASAFL